MQMTTEVVVSAGVRLSTDVAASDVDRQDPYTDWTTVVAGFARQAVDAGEIDPRWDPDLVGWGRRPRLHRRADRLGRDDPSGRPVRG
ncbi:hypothetical protein, partial [Pseudomonas viridiflava]|uniref:hypothetical protein n=1 Tax=Pseudomonas viridiflava TaxID=33069 RepID=UPI00197D7E88